MLDFCRLKGLVIDNPVHGGPRIDHVRTVTWNRPYRIRTVLSSPIADRQSPLPAICIPVYILPTGAPHVHFRPS
jgi:hypothetical protein